jgi:hypothetical protein
VDASQHGTPASVVVQFGRFLRDVLGKELPGCRGIVGNGSRAQASAEWESSPDHAGSLFHLGCDLERFGQLGKARGPSAVKLIVQG